MPRTANVPFGDEPDAPRWIEWRLVLYPLGLLCGALALAVDEPRIRLAFFLVFSALMLAPLAIKAAAWGGLRRTLKWMFFTKRLKVTTEGWFFLVLTIVFGVAAVNTGTNLLYLVLSMLLALMVVSGMMSELNLKGLRLARELPREVFAGEDARLKILVQNPRRRIPSFTVDVREASGPFGAEGRPEAGPVRFIARIRPGEHRALSYTARFERRGVYLLRGFLLTTRFPFGFFTKLARANLECELVVYPRALPLRTAAVEALGRAREARRARLRSFAPEEFRSLRAYRPGDNPRWIHWRSSARLGALVVKEFEPRSSNRALVLLDACAAGLALEAPEAGAPSPAVRALDRGTTLCASLVEHLTRRGERPEIAIVRGDEVTRFGQESGARAGIAVLDSLARLTPTADDTPRGLALAAVPAARAGARVYALSARSPQTVRRALQAKLGDRATVTVLCVRTEADLDRWVERPAPEEADA